MATLEELEQQKAELDKQIKEASKTQKAADLKLVRQLCKRHGFTYSMLKKQLNEGRKKNK
jgi:SOS response regulatory protein OraA/RecX